MSPRMFMATEWRCCRRAMRQHAGDAYPQEQLPPLALRCLSFCPDSVTEYSHQWLREVELPTGVGRLPAQLPPGPSLPPLPNISHEAARHALRSGMPVLLPAATSPAPP